MAPNISRRWHLPILLSCAVAIYIVGKSSKFEASPGTPAHRITAKELMARPLAKDLTTIPKLIHQSWSTDELPTKFRKWSSSCRKHNPGWEWVLWTDEDNDELVDRYFPWFLDAYKALPGPISRADVVRNMYMHIFGGVYADLDTECLRPYEELLDLYNVSTVFHPFMTAPKVSTGQPLQRRAFFGRMGMELDFHDSIPNAWMASTPGHPFHLLPIEEVQHNMGGGGTWLGGLFLKGTEALAGPGALYDAINNYEQNHGGAGLDQHLIAQGYPLPYGQHEEMTHDVTILPWWYIYPYSWGRDGEQFRDLCWVTQDTFDAERCKEVIAVGAWPSYSITYWSHSWSRKGHDDRNMNRVNSNESSKVD